MIKSNEDVNNVILKQINDGLDKAETKLDEKIYGKTEIKVEPKYKTFREKYNA
jgi:ribosomal protein S24E